MRGTWNGWGSSTRCQVLGKIMLVFNDELASHRRN
jgi:hypothetical protein